MRNSLASDSNTNINSPKGEGNNLQVRPTQWRRRFNPTPPHPIIKNQNDILNVANSLIHLSHMQNGIDCTQRYP